MPAFDAYMMVDWSAASVPRVGVDSIWIAHVRRIGGRLRRSRLCNPATREDATRLIGEMLAQPPKSRRVLVGFDFPFGYVRGTAAALCLDLPAWRQTWRRLRADVRDWPDNSNNRFDVAESWNKALSGEPFPFWGNVRDEPRAHLTRRRFRRHGAGDLPERRLVDGCVPRAQPVWKLAYVGSVGSQTLLGIPRVWQLRNDPRFAAEAALWPFETGLADSPRHRIVFAEIYPSLLPPKPLGGKPKDAGQVTAVVDKLASLDETDSLTPFFAGDPGLDVASRTVVVEEEGWMLGVTGKRRYWVVR